MATKVAAKVVKKSFRAKAKSKNTLPNLVSKQLAASEEHIDLWPSPLSSSIDVKLLKSRKKIVVPRGENSKRSASCLTKPKESLADYSDLYSDLKENRKKKSVKPDIERSFFDVDGESEKVSFTTQFEDWEVDTVLRVVCMTEKDVAKHRGGLDFKLAYSVFDKIKTTSDFIDMFGGIYCSFIGNPSNGWWEDYEEINPEHCVRSYEFEMLFLDVGRPLIEKACAKNMRESKMVRDILFYEALRNAVSYTFPSVLDSYWRTLGFLNSLGVFKQALGSRARIVS